MRYSSGDNRFFNSWYSAVQFVLLSSKASASPPQPTYCDKISCSCGVAYRCSPSICSNSLMASTFLRNFSFGVPIPRSSLLIWKLTAFLLSGMGLFSSCEGSVTGSHSPVSICESISSVWRSASPFSSFSRAACVSMESSSSGNCAINSSFRWISVISSALKRISSPSEVSCPISSTASELK